MMLTTPAIASVPYTAEAPSRSTSMRSMATVGSVFRSTAWAVYGLLTTRCPFSSTRVREGPRPRRSTYEAPPLLAPTGLGRVRRALILGDERHRLLGGRDAGLLQFFDGDRSDRQCGLGLAALDQRARDLHSVELLGRRCRCLSERVGRKAYESGAECGADREAKSRLFQHFVILQLITRSTCPSGSLQGFPVADRLGVREAYRMSLR